MGPLQNSPYRNHFFFPCFCTMVTPVLIAFWTVLYMTFSLHSKTRLEAMVSIEYFMFTITKILVPHFLHFMSIPLWINAKPWQRKWRGRARKCSRLLVIFRAIHLWEFNFFFMSKSFCSANHHYFLSIISWGSFQRRHSERADNKDGLHCNSYVLSTILKSCTKFWYYAYMLFPCS